MRFLQLDHITSLYCCVDDLVNEPEKPKGGRPPALKLSETITLLLWNGLTMKQALLSDIHRWAVLYHKRDFPRLPAYNRFVDHCHKAIPALTRLLSVTLDTTAPLRFLDSTMIDVCELIRATTHKVAKDIAAFGKNHQRWHYGLKLHAGINVQGRFTSLVFTPANVYDAQLIPKLVNAHTRFAVGDSHYGASVMRQKVWSDFQTIIIAPPHHTQKKKLMTFWQHQLLKTRPKIEAVFDYLKRHMHLVSSFPRSIPGYFLHYFRILLSYQFSFGF